MEIIPFSLWSVFFTQMIVCRLCLDCALKSFRDFMSGKRRKRQEVSGGWQRQPAEPLAGVVTPDFSDCVHQLVTLCRSECL